MREFRFLVQPRPTLEGRYKMLVNLEFVCACAKDINKQP